MRPIEIHKTKPSRKNEKRRSYTPVEKLAIIEQVKTAYGDEDALSQIAVDLNVKRKTLVDMLKNEDKLIQLVEEGKGKLKKNRKQNNPELEERLVKWIKDTKEQSSETAISGDLVQVIRINLSSL